MLHRSRGAVIGAIVGVLLLGACGRATPPEDESTAPARVERVAGSDLTRVVLTQKAAERLDIQTAAARTIGRAGGSSQRTVIPYAAVLYDQNGSTWTYTNPQPLVFVRQPIRVAEIDADGAVLYSGPPAGTLVVTVGAAELFGLEYGGITEQ